VSLTKGVHSDWRNSYSKSVRNTSLREVDLEGRKREAAPGVEGGCLKKKTKKKKTPKVFGGDFLE